MAISGALFEASVRPTKACRGDTLYSGIGYKHGIRAALKVAAVYALALLHPATATAHHAEALFDHSAQHSVTGTVRDFLWANPHALIYLEVIAADGHRDVDVYECGSVIVMRRNGWTRESLKVGDKSTIEYYPRRDKGPGGQLISATMRDGGHLTWHPATKP